MNNEGKTESEGATLTEHFNFASKTLVHNLEVAALMDDGSENDGKSLPGGVRGRSGIAEMKLAQKREERRRNKFYADFIQTLLQKAIDRLNEIIRYHSEQMEKLLEEIAEAQKRLEEFKVGEKALREAARQFEESGALELDENGQLANEQAEEAVRAYEERTGQKIDRTDPFIYEIILEALMLNGRDREQARQEIAEKTKRYEHHKKQKEKAETIKTELESGDPERCQNALREMESFDKIQQYEVTRNLSNSNPALSVYIGFEGFEALENPDEDVEPFSFGFPAMQNDFSDANSQSGENKNGQPSESENNVATIEAKPLKPKP